VPVGNNLLVKPFKIVSLYYKNIKDELNNIKPFVIKNQVYLRNGKYRLSGKTKNILHRNTRQTNDFVDKYLSNLKPLEDYKIKKINFINRMKHLISIFFYKALLVFNYIKINSSKRSKKFFQGDLIIILRGNNRYKIVDFQSKEIITFESDGKKLNSIRNGFKHFGVHFNTTIIEINQEKKFIREQLVDYVPYQFLTTKRKMEIYDNLLENILKCLSNIDKTIIKKIKIEEIIENIKKNYNDDNLTKFINQCFSNDFLRTEFSLTIQHHDINFANLLIKKDTYFLIDFEWTQNSIFFIDIFRIFDSEIDLFRGRDPFLLNELRQGSFNEKIKLIFKLFEVNYDSKLLSDYILFSVLALWNNVRDYNKNKIFSEKDNLKLHFIYQYFNNQTA
jgi:hypothetical protein